MVGVSPRPEGSRALVPTFVMNHVIHTPDVSAYPGGAQSLNKQAVRRVVEKLMKLCDETDCKLDGSRR